MRLQVIINKDIQKNRTLPSSTRDTLYIKQNLGIDLILHQPISGTNTFFQKTILYQFYLNTRIFIYHLYEIIWRRSNTNASIVFLVLYRGYYSSNIQIIQ